MAADLAALRRAADLLDDWGKGVGHHAMLNDTDPAADLGTRIFASTITALASKARSEAAAMRMRALAIEAMGSEETEQRGNTDGE